MTSRLYCDLKEDHNGNITGTIKLPADSRFTFEAISTLIETFSQSCEIETGEIVSDLGKFLEGRV